LVTFLIIIGRVPAIMRFRGIFSSQKVLFIDLLKIKCRAKENSDFDENDIFDRFSSRRIFRVGEHFCEKKLKILDFLTFEGIIHCLALLGFGCISMSKFQWYAWGVLKINIFLGI
jgi:hypothetical protein